MPGKPDHYTVFDNGNFRTPQFSRAVEYKINTDSMTAEKIWEYRSEPYFFSGWMGNVQRLENGNTLVNWASSHLPKPTEISPEGDVVYQSSLYYSSNVYRVFKFDWEGILKVPYLILEQEKEFLRLLFNKFGDSKIEYYKVYFQEEGQMMSLLDTAKNTWFIVDYNIFKNHSNVSFFVTAVDSMGNESGYSNVVSAFVNHFEDGENLILNGDFSNGLKYWEIQIGDSATANYSVNESNELVLNIENGGENISDIKIIYSKVPLFAQNEYILEFDAFTNSNRLINISVERSTSPYTDYSQIGNIHLSRSLTHYIYKFNMTLFSDAEANLVIRAGKDNGDIILDNISLKTDNVSSAEFKNGNVKKFYLSQNYPNPFNPVTKIRYSIPDPLDNGKKRGTQNVKLIVYDVLGREVVVLVDKEQKPGKYELEWNPNANGLNLSSGIYFYKITAGSFRETRKMIFLK